MISAWDVYWVMQLDRIQSAVEILGFVGLVTAIGLTVWNGISRFDTNEYPSLCDPEHRASLWASRGRLRTKVLAFALPAILLSAFIPSTKTAAAMIVLPAVANSETIQSEAGDLYRLAKKALADAVGDDGAD